MMNHILTILGILEPAGTLLVRWLFQPFDMLRRLGAFGGTKVSKAKMNLQLQDTQLVPKTHRTLNIFNFSCEQFLLKKIAQQFFPKTMESTTYLWVLFAPSVCGVLHHIIDIRFHGRTRGRRSEPQPWCPCGGSTERPVEDFFGKACRLSQKTAGHGNNGTNQRFLMISLRLKMFLLIWQMCDGSCVASMFPMSMLSFVWGLLVVENVIRGTEAEQRPGSQSVATFVFPVPKHSLICPMIIATKTAQRKAPTVDDGLGLGPRLVFQNFGAPKVPRF